MIEIPDGTPLAEPTIMTNETMIRVTTDEGNKLMTFSQVRHSFRMDDEELRALEAGDRVSLETATIECHFER